MLTILNNIEQYQVLNDNQSDFFNNIFKIGFRIIKYPLQG